MRYLLLGFAAALVLGLANAPMARAFETRIDDSTNADGSPKFADPDEQLEALADGGGGGSGYVIRMPSASMIWNCPCPTGSACGRSLTKCWFGFPRRTPCNANSTL